MTVQQDSFEFAQRRPVRKTVGSRSRIHPLHEAALRLADLGFSRSRSRTRDLVAFLLCHGARTWRVSQPRARVRIKVSADGGNKAVRLRVG